MKSPRRGTVNPSGENEHGYEVDLNDARFQERLFNYIINGLPSSDARGHSVNLQTSVIPIQSDVLESIKSKAPKNFWRNQSEMLRSVMGVGCLVILRVLTHRGLTMDEEFRLMDLINAISKNKREKELYAEVQQCIYEMNRARPDMPEKISELEQAFKDKQLRKARQNK